MSEVNLEMLENALKELKSTELSSLKIEVQSKRELAIKESKFFGHGYIPRGFEIPKSSNDENLSLLAQFNLEDIPKNSFPLEKGILQFWIDLSDDCYGMDFDDGFSGEGHKVIYHENITDDYLSKEEIDEIYAEDEQEFSVCDTMDLPIEFKEDKELMGPDDYRFNDVFIPIWNKLYPDNEIESVFDLPDNICDELFSLCDSYSHKLLGYPGFTQSDPREFCSNPEVELLFQMDSDYAKKYYEILWGDCGICNFFIDKNDLLKKDFSNVLYNWDCS